MANLSLCHLPPFAMPKSRWNGLILEKYHVAAGIDTLTVLSMGNSGWRAADRWLREQYPHVQNSVVNPNYLHYASAVCEGEFVMPSTKIQLMYDPDVVAYTPQGKIVIKGNK